jgi:hypothetical protein
VFPNFPPRNVKLRPLLFFQPVSLMPRFCLRATAHKKKVCNLCRWAWCELTPDPLFSPIAFRQYSSSSVKRNSERFATCAFPKGVLIEAITTNLHC